LGGSGATAAQEYLGSLPESQEKRIYLGIDRDQAFRRGQREIIDKRMAKMAGDTDAINRLYFNLSNDTERTYRR
jgi:hypothetical protein